MTVTNTGSVASPITIKGYHISATDDYDAAWFGSQSISPGNSYNYSRTFTASEINNCFYIWGGTWQYYLYAYGNTSSSFSISNFSLILDYNPTVTATASVTSASSTGTNSGQFSYSFSNCITGVSSQPLCYYYSTSNTTPSGNGSSQPYSTQTINNWCKLTDNSSSTGTQTLSGLSSGQRYYVWVSGTAQSGATPQTQITIWGENNTLSDPNYFDTSSSPTYTASPPTSVTASVQGSSSVTISWSAGSSSSNNPITGYQVGYATSQNGTKTTVNVSGSSTLSKTITGLTLSTGYYFWVKTICQNQNSGWSTAYDYAQFIPPSITAVSASNLQATITVNTGTCTGTIWYRYITSDEYNTYGSSYNYSPDSGSSSQNPIVTTVPSGGNYYFQVNMSNGFGSYSYSNVFGPRTFTDPTGYCTPPNEVTFTIQTLNTRTAQIAWSGGSGNTNNTFSTYHWVWSTSSTNPPTEISGQYGNSSSSPKTGITLPTISSNTTFYAFVQTRGSAGSNYYSTFTRGSLTVNTCTAPTSVEGSGGLLCAYVNWSGAQGGTNNAIQSYNIGYSTAANATTPNNDTIITGITSTSYTYSNLTAGTSYYFFVQSVGVFNTSGWRKASVSITPYNYGNCGAPTSVIRWFDDGIVYVYWEGATGGINNNIKEYSVGYRQTSSQPSQSTTPTTSKSITSTQTSGMTYFSGLTVGQTYYFGVKTLGTASGYDSPYYTWTTSGIEIPAHPTVASGNPIQASDMATLRAYKNYNPNAITANTEIYASDGNTYKNNLTAGTTQVAASWYNGA